VDLARRPDAVDPAEVAWIVTALHHDSSVGSLVPPVFEAYARVFHPAARYVGDEDVDVPWSAVAVANGMTAHPAMEWASITGSVDYLEEADQPGTWNQAPAQGHLAEHVARRMVDVLRTHTTTPDDCYIGVDESLVVVPEHAPLLPLGGTSGSVLVVRGPVDLAAVSVVQEPFNQSPSVWWPADRAWYVATNLDLVTTYVGGTAACIADLLAVRELESARVAPDQRVSSDADEINPPPDSW